MDFGGTKLLIGEVDAQGNILRRKRYPSGCRTEAEAVRVLKDSLKDYMETVGAEGDIKGAGVGIVGTVDYRNGIWVSMHPKAVSEPIPLSELLQDILRIPVWIDNDVKSATTAEMIFGDGIDSENFIYLNVGTGLAAGFVVDGRILRGSRNDTGEIGHTVSDLQSEDICICGRKGCIEGAVSGYGFSKMAHKYGIRRQFSPQGDLVSVAELYERAKLGEEIPVQILDYAAKSLSCMIMNLVKTLDPEMIILGGGCVRDGYLLEHMRRWLNPDIMCTVIKGIKISKLNPEFIGLLGAAALPIAVHRQECRMS